MPAAALIMGMIAAATMYDTIDKILEHVARIDGNIQKLNEKHKGETEHEM
jgi:hypothetical protein